jgi:hypothetical protein
MTRNSPNHQEARQLLDRIHDLMPILGDDSQPLWELEERIEQIQKQEDIDPLEVEKELEAVSMEIRRVWLYAARQVSVDFLKSPPHEQAKVLPSGRRVQFDYERGSHPKSLEHRSQKICSVPKGWRSTHLIFSSGMGALSSIIQLCCARLDGPAPKSPVMLDMFGGYFETWRLLDLRQGLSMDVHHLQSNDELIKRLEAGLVDVMLIEPVAYDWEMTVFDHDAFIRTWKNSTSKRPRVLLFDSSLTGHRYRIENLLSELRESPPWLVINVRSGIKLDQEGLELANVGIADLYVPARGSPANLQDLKTRLGAIRSILGTGLSFDQMAALEVPWFLNKQRFEDYGNAVFENNAALARQIASSGGVFSKISHPALGENCDVDWAVAPFVVFYLSEDSRGNHGFLIAVLATEAKRRGLQFTLGSSFGFRGHRFEVIKPMVHLQPNIEQTGLLKIAMGARRGPSFDGVIDLVNETAAIESFAALRKAYPDVKAYVKDRAGIYVARPSRG